MAFQEFSKNYLSHLIALLFQPFLYYHYHAVILTIDDLDSVILSFDLSL